MNPYMQIYSTENFVITPIPKQHRNGSRTVERSLGPWNSVKLLLAWQQDMVRM